MQAMTAAFAFVVGLLCVLGANGLPQAPEGDPIGAIQGLVERVLGKDVVSKFEFEIIPADDLSGMDVFELDHNQAKIVVRGNTGVSLASGLNHYLKYWCNCTVTWGRDGTGDQLNLPSPLPLPADTVRVVSPVKYRYYQNVCTVSYSMVWWDFARWEREIDWMALNGLNLILAFTGQEYIWKKFYSNVGLTDEEIDDYFSGPAFLAWQRMGNIHLYGGPLCEDWINNQYQLQKMILARLRLFGMIPVLPGFSGIVPGGLRRVLSEANFTRSSDWNGFGPVYSENYFLEPTDSHFKALGTAFYKLMISEFGTDHVYNADTYNEMDPSSSDLDFLAETNQAVYEAMQDADPEAVFMMQGWLFHSGFWRDTSRIKAYLSKVPNDSMIILDLNSEADPVWTYTESYYGKPFVWCLLHNYGGNRGIYGDLTTIATQPIVARQANGSTMIGTGMTPEAIEQNPVMYDLMAEMGWSKDPVDVDTWLSHYATRRYGGYSQLAQDAWAILKPSAYTFNYSLKSLIDLKPGLNLKYWTALNATGILAAWQLLYQAVESKQIDPSIGPFQYDLVDIGRQCMVNLFFDLYSSFVATYRSVRNNVTLDGSKKVALVQPITEAMLKVILKTDEFLATNVNFLLGTWVSDALATVNTSRDKENVVFNALNQITVWGPLANINDYACKDWAGLLSAYYHQRWSLFFDYTLSTLSKTDFINTTLYNRKMFEFELSFSRIKQEFPTKPTGDSMLVAKELQDSYFNPDLINSNFHPLRDTEIQGHNLLGEQGPYVKNINQVAYVCYVNPLCTGFSSQGQLKNSTAPYIIVEGAVFFVKKYPHH